MIQSWGHQSTHRHNRIHNHSTPDFVHAGGRVHFYRMVVDSVVPVGLQHIHLGIFMIRLHALHQRSAGTNALVVLRDTRWEDSRQIIATMEVDLSAGTQLVYTFPDMILSVNDFHNLVEVAIQTHGQVIKYQLYGISIQHGKRCGSPHHNWHHSNSRQKRSIEELEGMSWHLKPPEQTSVRAPSRVAVNERLNILESAYKLRKKNISLMTYDAPPDTTPIEEIAATGWGDEFSDDEVTPGKLNTAYPPPLDTAYPVLCPIQHIQPNKLIRPRMTKVIKGEFEKIKDIKVEDDSLTCNSLLKVFNLDDDSEHEADDMGFDPSDIAFTEWLGSKFLNYKTMDHYTMKALWIYWIGGDDEVELTDEEFSNNENEIVEVFRVDTNIFDYETPIFSAFNEFNYLLKVDPDLLTKDIMGFKTYDDYKDDWIYEWNKDVPWVDEKPWTKIGVWT
ncbi:hypothetical protein Tco_0753276 [Tanacetum coccineum]